MQSRSIKTQSGHPLLEENQSLFIQVIFDIATHGRSTADRRRSEVLRTCKILDELHARLVKDNFFILRTYCRLIPKFSGSIEGKSHVTIVPVNYVEPKLIDTDRHFCKATANDLEEFAPIFYINL